MAKNIVWHNQRVSHEKHEELNGHRGLCIWFTGLSGAGKSTLANAVEQQLFSEGIHTYLLDGDNVRHGLCQDLGFDAASREENVRRVANVANLFADAGVVTITALISPFRRDRRRAREIMRAGTFVEVYVKCPIDVCMERDPKGLYQKAKSGQIKDFTGISSPYEEPEAAEITVDTSENSIEDCVEQIMQKIRPFLAHQLQ